MSSSFYFSDPDRWERVLRIIESWMGTPHRHMWAAKGRGADCSLWVGAVMQEAGIIRQLIYSHVPQDWYHHVQDELLMQTFFENVEQQLDPDLAIRSFRMEEFRSRPVAPMRGDLLCISFLGRGAAHHMGILMDPPTSFVHSIGSRGVTVTRFTPHWLAKTKTIHRVEAR